MIIRPNKEGADWLVIKAELNDRIAAIQEDMLNSLSVEDYHRCRGAILLARDLIEWVEPTTPPKTTEESYGYTGQEGETYT